MILQEYNFYFFAINNKQSVDVYNGGTYYNYTTHLHVSRIMNSLYCVGFDGSYVINPRAAIFDITTIPEKYRPKKNLWARFSLVVGTGTTWEEVGYIVVLFRTDGRVSGSANTTRTSQIVGTAIFYDE